MASRNRNRLSQQNSDADEERSIWNQLREDARRVDSLAAKADDLQARADRAKNEIYQKKERGDHVTVAEIDTLMDICRQFTRVNEDCLQAARGDNDGGNFSIIGSLELLAALRASSEADSTVGVPPRNGGSSNAKSRTKRKADAIATTNAPSDDRDSVSVGSPRVPSPKVAIPSRQMAKAGGSRAGSVPAGREASVKVEDGSVESSDNAKEPRLKLTVGTEVLYRPTRKPSTEGEGILCHVTSIIGDGKQRRYEIKDADPEPPTPSVPYRASVSHMVPIPPETANATLPELPPKKNVLALYPGTTTFYKAEVVAMKAGGKVVRLKFEGEDEADREMEVERRYVLVDK